MFPFEKSAVIPALLLWCRDMRTLDLPELDILNDFDSAAPEHYRHVVAEFLFMANTALSMYYYFFTVCF